MSRASLSALKGETAVERGPMFSGAVRDPTGLHLWSVGSFRPELHIEMEELWLNLRAGTAF